MASFGRFETIRELHRTGFTVVYSGQEAAGPEEKFALKIFQPSSLILEEDKVKTESDRFLNSARIQQKVAASGAQHWAPVYDCGSTPDGTFYATDKYDRSLQKLIDGRIKLSGHVLHAIVESIVKGLIEFKEECGRPHGNLKAANVLIVGTGEISQTKIVLSDPLSDDQIDSEIDWNRDLRVIAEFIYELMTHRSTPAVDGWQVPDSDKWTTLGKQANGWRNLCNLLLSACVKPGTITIEAVIEELEKLKKAKPVLTPLRVIAAGLVVIVCITVLVMLLRQPPPPEKTEWENLCKQYQAWVDGLRQDLAKRGETGQGTQVRWSQDPELGRILEKIETASYPYKVMLNEGKLYIREIISHPEYAEQRKAQDAVRAIEEIGGFFDPNSANTWPLLAEMSDAAGKFRNRGWQKSATYLSDLVEKVKPEPNKPILEDVDMVLELSQKGVLKNIDLSLQNIAEYEKTIKSSGDPVLVKLDSIYVTDQVADATDPNELSDRLGKLVDIGRTIAEFIESDWQKNIDQETFLNDHGKDPAEIPTALAFTERLDVVKEYYYLRPDPREALFGLVTNIERYIEEALVSNPKEAKGCSQDLELLRPKIVEVQQIKPIEKNKQQIEQRISQYKPQLGELLDRADRARELPRDYVQRIQKEVISTAKTDKVNEKWILLRDKLLNKYSLSVIEQNLESYAQLRQKMDKTHDNLIVLDKELQTQLPLKVGSEVGEKDWKLKLAQAYDQERNDRISRIIEEIPLTNDIPDVNDGIFKDFRIAQFSEFKQLRSDLVGIFTAFDAIEAGLELYYLLDDDLPQSNQNIRSVWQKWKDIDTLKDTRIRDGLAELIARISKLEQIEQSKDQRELVQIAFDTSLHNEAVYAAWIRLDELPDSSWPAQHEDLTQDRSIRDGLKKEFETIRSKNETRGDYLFQVLAGTSLKHEIEFIDKNRSEDGVLGKLVEFATEVNPADSLSECQKVESLAKDVADFVAGEDWQAGKIDKDLFSTESTLHNSNAPVTIETFGQWLMEVKDYKKLEDDPRNDSQYSWDDRISKIDREINNELERKPESDYLKKLQGLKGDFDGVMQRISDMRRLPLIEKHKEEIFKCGDYWKELLEVERRLKPEYCKRVDLDDGRLVFATSYLQPNFEPVDVDNKNPVRLSTAWEQIREAVNKKQRQWLDFFYTIDGNDVLNVGWPKYIRSTKDPTVVLRFIPVSPDNEEPFYMATHEITNGQYRLFLEKNGAKRGSPKLPGWSIFTDQTNNKLIQCTVANKPPSVIKWDESGNTFIVAEADANLPVTWVTYYGAQSYSQWSGGQLPTASQHEYACRAGTGNIHPWGNNILEIGSFAHVRGPAWRNAASIWSREKDKKVPPLPIAPVGAIEDYQQDRILDPNGIVNTSSTYNSVWPVASANKSNAWGLYNMIGNVWEWCQSDGDDTQSVVCGGSCLAPSKYILLESESDYKVSFSDRDNDVGFRVIVPAK